MFGVSNLSWDDDDKAKQLMDRYNIKYIEVAPTVICSWDDLSSDVLKTYEKKIGRKIISMQSVLFKTNLSMTTKTDCVAILKHFNKLIKICNEVKIPKIVFGSPTARIVNCEEDKTILFNNLKKINEMCRDNNVYFCLENNCKHYGSNFMTTTLETYDVIEKLNLSHIKLHIDTGNMFMEDEDLNNILKCLKHLESFHISDRNLGRLFSTKSHKIIGDILEYINYNKYITLETIDKKLEYNLQRVFENYTFNTKRTCLIGHTGFIGSNLKEKMFFTDYYNSKNIHTIANKYYDEIYCCGAPGRKWYANKYPKKDLESINKLIEYVKQVQYKRMILISTIDVYDRNKTNEDSTINDDNLDAYGKHRYMLEQTFKDNNNCTIFRLGALYGRYLKKNIIYDMLHQNNVNRIPQVSYFQWYNLDNLLDDINIYKDVNGIINLFSKPISTEKICNLFGYERNVYKNITPKCYDIGSKYYEQETQEEVLYQIKNFIKSYKKIYNVYLINTTNLPIPHTHGLCCRKLLKGFMYNGCHIKEVRNEYEFDNIEDSDDNIFIYSDHYRFYKTKDKALLTFSMLGKKYQKTWHICWYMTEMLRTNMVFKNFIMTGEYLESPFEELEKEKQHIITLYNKYNFVPMSFGVDINPYEDIIYDNDLSKCTNNYCFIGTPYKREWTTTLERCLYFSHRYTGRYCLGDEKEHNMKNSIIGLGFNSIQNCQNGVVTDRIYESLAYCKLCFTDSKAAVNATNGIAIYVSSPQDIKDKFEYYMNNKTEMFEKNRLGKELIKTKGTYFHSAQNYLKFITDKRR